MSATWSNFNTNYWTKVRPKFTHLLWGSALLIVLSIIAGMCSPRFEHFWEGLVVLNKL